MRLGVDLGGTKTEILALGQAGAERLCRRVPTPAGYDAILACIAGLVAEAEAALGPARGVGIGIPGSIGPVSGVVRNANTTALNGRALESDLEAALGRPVRIGNDADCFALAEAADGAGRGAGSVFGVILGTGVGGGVVIGGRLHRGANRIAGEWGHTPLPLPRDDERPGPVCHCRRRGCVETWLSGPGLAADHARATGARATAEQIAAAAEAGDPAARSTLARHLDRLGRALGPVANILDPEVIVLGGGLSNMAHLARDLPAALAPHVFSDSVATRIARHALGDSAGALGAARLWPAPAHVLGSSPDTEGA
jgi:fructokinase